MSYILDSLKKSEQQRRQGELPNLQSDHPGAMPPPPRKRAVWPWLVVAVLLVNAGVLAWWLTSTSSSPPPVRMSKAGVSQAQAAPDKPAPAASPPGMPTRMTPASAAPVKPPSVVQAASEQQPPKSLTVQEKPTDNNRQAQPVPASSASQPAKASQPAPSPPAVAGTPAIIPLEELPTDIRSGLPDLKLSLLYYTAAPEKRMARLNGRNLREGETVEAGVTLKEIRPEGAVISFRGKLILIPRP